MLSANHIFNMSWYWNAEKGVSRQRNENDRSMFIHSLIRQIEVSRIHSHIPFSKNIVVIFLVTVSFSTYIFSHLSPKGLRVMVLNATFNNISVISWWSVLLVKKTGVPGVNHRPATSHWQTLSHIEYTSPERDLNSQRWWWQDFLLINASLLHRDS